MIPLHPPTDLSVPTPAERARSVLCRPNPATVTSSDLSLHLTGPTCHTTSEGEITLLVPDRHLVLAEIGTHPLEVSLEFTDTAPVDLRDPARSLLWINGTLRLPSAVQARSLAVAVAAQDPDERLLDLGHGRTMVVLAPEMVVHSDREGCHMLTPSEFTAAPADPFGRWEGPWLRHLEDKHSDVLWSLVAQCPGPLPQGRPRPLGVDRHGLQLRLEGPEGDHDVRIPFHRPARTPDDVAHEVQTLAGITQHQH